MSKTFRNAAGRPVDVSSGQVVGAGERIELKLDNDHDKDLVANNHLILIHQGDLDAEAKAGGVKGGSN